MEDSSLLPPSKRQKTSPEENGPTMAEISMQAITSDSKAEGQEKLNEDQLKEQAIGVKAFVSPGPLQVDSGSISRYTFRGILKKRYTDFLVNEILLDGKVVRLQSTKPAKAQLPAQRQVLSSGDNERGQPSPSEQEGINGNSTSAHAQEEGDATDTTNVPQESSSTKAAVEETRAAAVASNEASSQRISFLQSSLGEQTASELVSLFDRIKADDSNSRKPRERFDTIKATSVLDRAARTEVHESVRNVFSSRIESSTDKDGFLLFSAAPKSRPNPSGGTARGSRGYAQQQRNPKPSWSELGGDYLHFSIYKENKDTMEVISYLSRQLRMNAKSFAFAGTKDKRAVTVQRASVYRCEAERLAGINRTLRGSAVGDFKYETQGLSLGDLGGNEFCIALRDCSFTGDHEHGPKSQSIGARRDYAQTMVTKALSDLREKGFLNYYGLQRFGTFAARTDAVGIKLLQGDFQAAVDTILDYNPDALSTPDQANEASSNDRRISSDDHARASAINLFRNTGSSHQALEKLPRKFSAESNVIRHLSKSPRDFFGALQMIPRNLRLMYVHAYQSLVWNNAVNARWSAFGSCVVEGDLVLAHEHRDKEIEIGRLAKPAAAAADADTEGEAVVLPAAGDSAMSADDAFERARPLSASEAQSGAYSIFDIVLPLPGFDVLYPENGLKDWYKDFMGSEEGGGLDPFDMRRKHRDFSLSGGYRKVVARIGEGWSAEVREYGRKGEDEQFVKTDLERIRGAEKEKEREKEEGDGVKAEEKEDVPQGEGVETGEVDDGGDGGDDKLAVILKFRLGASQYATMALRELSKGGIVAYKGEYSGGRGR
ncbi:MAG: hypothetical protein Q9160_007008 [Pyrenula sp. 1 TL-2023]